jgi:mono/diheme cytochrome c family protein
VSANLRGALVLAAVLSSCAPATTQQSATDAGGGATLGGNATLGAKIFKTSCAACHGPTGVEGGVIGPSLRHESARMDYATVVSWIEDPQPPMPHLYPKVLNSGEVRDLAAYVEGL